MAGNREAYDAAMRAGHEQARRSNWTAAANDYRRAIGEFPNDVAAHTSLAMIWYRLGSLEQSLAELEFVQRLAPDDQRIAAKIDELRSALSGEAPAPRPTGPLRSGTGPLAGAAWAGSRPQEALLSVLAGRRARDGEYAGAPSAPGADGVPGLIGAVLSATGTKERLDHFAELVTDIRSDPEAGDVESEGRAADEAAARAA